MSVLLLADPKSEMAALHVDLRNGGATAALERSPFKPKLTRRFVTVIRRNAERRLPRFAAEADATAGSSEDDLEVGSWKPPPPTNCSLPQTAYCFQGFHFRHN